jgi:hypothetical protein
MQLNHLGYNLECNVHEADLLVRDHREDAFMSFVHNVDM